MPTGRLQRLLPLSGALFAVVMTAGLLLTSGEPDSGAPKAHIYDYWQSHYGRQLVSSLLLIPLGIVFLLAFAAEVRRAVRSDEADAGAYSPLALAGGIVAGTGLGVTGSLSAAVATAAHHHAADATYTLAQLQSYDWVPWMVGFAVLLLASGIGGLRTSALPKPLAVIALVLGIASLTPAGYLALLAFPLWTLATGIALYRRQRTPRPSPGRAATQPA